MWNKVERGTPSAAKWFAVKVLSLSQCFSETRTHDLLGFLLLKSFFKIGKWFKNASNNYFVVHKIAIFFSHIIIF